jgi:hypothetical protein
MQSENTYLTRGERTAKEEQRGAYRYEREAFAEGYDDFPV